MPAYSTNENTLKQRRLKEKQKRDLTHYLVSFAMMVVLTVLAFIAVASDNISAKFAPLFIIVLAVIQVIFQLFYFMHVKDKGHGIVAIFLAGGATIAVLSVATLMTLIW